MIFKILSSIIDKVYIYDLSCIEFSSYFQVIPDSYFNS